MNDATLTYQQWLIDRVGRPIVELRRGTVDVDGARPYFLGKTVTSSPAMPVMGAAKNSGVFGSPYYFIQRRVPSATIMCGLSSACCG